MDGVLTNVRSSWCWIHQCFNVDNELAYKAYCDGKINECEFMKRDINLWIKKKPDITIYEIAAMFIDMPLINGIRETILCLKNNGIKSVIISGGINLAAKMISDKFGFDEYIADEICYYKNGLLTGEGKMNVDLKDKGSNVRKYIKQYNTATERVVSIGNSFSDISMFENSGMSIAFNPTDRYT